MSSELVIRAVHQGGMRYTADDGEQAVAIDYPLEPGEACVGLTPLKLLLTSLAGCSGNTVGLVLARMRQPVQAIDVNARGVRRDEHPTVLTDISLEFLVRGDDIDPEAVQKAIALAESQLCPVWAMLKEGTPIHASFRIETPQVA